MVGSVLYPAYVTIIRLKGACLMVSNKIFTFVMISMCISTISLTITKNKLFSPLRSLVRKRFNWLGTLLSCPYCISHWLAFFLVILFYHYTPVIMVTDLVFLDIIITIFATISLATIITGVMYFIIKKF
ncbi:DUF1360 domain-containing protein [Desulforamulus aquiferis]|uniref:DUF1360 domain-containing protein n=1 Tax=Desulforamulus aquiferis TaxID=1397668 RepID=UPI003570C492